MGDSKGVGMGDRGDSIWEPCATTVPIPEMEDVATLLSPLSVVFIIQRPLAQ